MSKSVKINKAFGGILSVMSEHDLKNAYFGGSNLLVTILNDYSTDGINEYIGEWLDDHLNKPYNNADISAYSIIDNPDYLIQCAAAEFHSGLSMLFSWKDKQNSEHVMRNAKYDLASGYAKFYVYAEPFGNNSTLFWIISADDESEALQTLICSFEDDFIITDTNFADKDCNEVLCNDNGNAVEIDNLQYIGMIDAS